MAYDENGNWTPDNPDDAAYWAAQQKAAAPPPTPANQSHAPDESGFTYDHDEGGYSVFKKPDGTLVIAGFDANGMRTWVPTAAAATAPKTDPTTTPPPPTTGGPTTTPGATINQPGPYNGALVTPPPVNLGGPKGIEYIPPTPQFHGPDYTPPPAFSFDDYHLPTYEEAQNEPGYKFSLDQGRNAVERGAAARGTLNTGGTLMDVWDYGANRGAQNYQNVVDRSMSTYGIRRANAVGNYNTNYQTQYTDPYNIKNDAAVKGFDAEMTGYKTQAAAGQHQNDMNTSNSWNQYLFGWDNYWKNFDERFKLATA